MKEINPILIITFYYPPYPKVGGRRWVKFAKYLFRNNKPVFVLAANMDVDKKSPWDTDASEIEHLTTRLHFKYNLPYFKKKLPTSFLSKIRWQLSKYLSNTTKKKNLGNPNDESEKYAKDFIKATKKIIFTKKIETVIFTASPNHLAYHISNLKREFNHIRFIFDLRDYWTDWMKHLSQLDLNYEKKLEEKTILNSDIIFTPAKKITETLKERYKQKSLAIKVLSHGFDSDDFLDLSKIEYSQKKTEKIHLIYAGSMYDNMEDNMKILVNLLIKNNQINISFYTYTEDYKNYFIHNLIKDRVTYYKPLSIREFILKAKNDADGLLYMRSILSDDSDFLSSKFFDFLPLRKPIIYLGNRGDALNFIEKEKIGFHLNDESISDFQKNLNTINKNLNNFDITQYSFSELTKQLITEIEN